MEDMLRRWLFDPTVGRLVLVLLGLLVIRVVLSVAQRSLGHRIHDAGLRYRVRRAPRCWRISPHSCSSPLSIASGWRVHRRLRRGRRRHRVRAAGGHCQRGRWLAISFGGFYEPGDRIQLGGIRGDVIDVGILRTTLMECGQWVNGDLYNGRIVRIANSFVFKEPVFNYSGDFPFVWDELMLPIKYGSDYVLARQMLPQVAEEIVGDYADAAEAAWTGVVTKFMIEHARVPPAVTLTANQNWIELTLRYVVNYKQRRATKDLLFTRILQEIDESAGQIGIAASTLSIEKLAPLEIRVADEVRVRGLERPAAQRRRPSRCAGTVRTVASDARPSRSAAGQVFL